MLPASKSNVRRLLDQAAAADDPNALLEAGAAALQSGTLVDLKLREMLGRHPANGSLGHLLGLLNLELQDSPAALDGSGKPRSCCRTAR